MVHRYWQHRVKEMFESAGWDAFLETFDADVYVHLDSFELAVEIAMGDNPREIKHVEKHMDKGFVVWILCRNEEIRNGLRQRLQEQDSLKKSVSFRLLRQVNEIELPFG